MMKILFVDTACGKPYNGNTLRNEGMGGSESSTIRVAEQFGKAHVTVVYIHNLITPEVVNGVLYTNVYPDDCTHVVILRNPTILSALRTRYKRARLYLWCTDLFDQVFASYRTIFSENRVTLIAVSDYHKHQIVQELLRSDSMAPVRVISINNIVDIQQIPTIIDTNKLIFASTYIKGLKTTLESFRKITDGSKLADLKLVIANPGYLPDFDINGYRNVTMLGTLKPEDLYKEVASSLCLFTTNRTFPETFGLVFAEANALGTPFIAHPLGALRSLYKNNFQLMDTYNIPLLIQTLVSWQTNRPKVTAHEQFKVAAVMQSWYSLLEGKQ